ncbi:hypothetical protein V2A60_000052 [Cordyceps javanica]
MAERNCFLDSATKRAAPAATSSPVERAEPKHDEVRSVTAKEPAVDDPKVNELEKDIDDSMESNDAGSAPNQNHICSGCGEPRSPSFHRKHPFMKAVHNVCRKCRESKRASKVMGRYHFCDSCGIVRSKEYHRRRGSTSSESMRLRICRKCHTHGSFPRQFSIKPSHNSKNSRGDRMRNKFVDTNSGSGTGWAKAKSRTVLKQPQRQNVSTENAGNSGYDGNFDLTLPTEKVTRPKGNSIRAEGEAFRTYRSPEISEEDASSNQAKSLASGFPTPSPDSSSFKAHSTPESRSPQLSHDDAVSESSEVSFDAPQSTPSRNPYYQPRNTARQLSSPFQYAEAFSHGHLPTVAPPSSQDFDSSPSAHRSDSDSPDVPDVPNKPRFVDRNQSWPGDLNLPLPGASCYLSNAARKVSPSDGANTPQLSPTFRANTQTDTDDGADADAGRFTTGAYAKFTTCSNPSPPASPWASFSGPNPSRGLGPETCGSKGAFYHEPGGGDSASQPSTTRREFAFGSYNAPPPPSSEPSSAAKPPSFPFRFERPPRSFSGRDARGEFASTRGAWNINTAGGVPAAAAAACRRRRRRRQFHLAEDLSDSGVEFPTGFSSSSSSSSSSPSSSKESLLASQFDGLAIYNH